jgi:hypothetical protein
MLEDVHMIEFQRFPQQGLDSLIVKRSFAFERAGFLIRIRVQFMAGIC